MEPGGKQEHGFSNDSNTLLNPIHCLRGKGRDLLIQKILLGSWFQCSQTLVFSPFLSILAYGNQSSGTLRGIHKVGYLDL